MRINWFSPLPPAESGVARYTAHLLPALCDRAEVVLWTDQAPALPPGDPRARVQQYHPDGVPWAEFNAADVSVYHLGNSYLHHGNIWRVSRCHPGVVVLHDLTLRDLFLGLGRPTFSEEPRTQQLPRLASALRGALAVLVHSPDAYEELKTRRHWPLACYPLPHGQPVPDAPGDYVDLLCRLAGCAPEGWPGALGHYLANRAGAEMGAWASGLDESACARVGRTIHGLVA